jgi:hypothetical protein
VVGLLLEGYRSSSEAWRRHAPTLQLLLELLLLLQSKHLSWNGAVRESLAGGCPWWREGGIRCGGMRGAGCGRCSCGVGEGAGKCYRWSSRHASELDDLWFSLGSHRLRAERGVSLRTNERADSTHLDVGVCHDIPMPSLLRASDEDVPEDGPPSVRRRVSICATSSQSRRATHSYSSPCGASIGGPFHSFSSIPASAANAAAVSVHPRFCTRNGSRQLSRPPCASTFDASVPSCSRSNTCARASISLCAGEPGEREKKHTNGVSHRPPSGAPSQEERPEARVPVSTRSASATRRQGSTEGEYLLSC